MNPTPTKRPILLSALLAAGVLISCDLNDSGEPVSGPASGTVAYMPRLVKRSGEPVTEVDSVHVRLWVGDTTGRRPQHDRSYGWSDNAAKIGDLPVESRYTVIIEGIKLGVDGTSRAVWWSASKTGFIEKSETRVHAEDLPVVDGDTVLPAVQAPSGSMAIPFGADSLTLAFTVPSDAASLFVNGERLGIPADRRFSVRLLAGQDSVKSVSVRIVDSSGNAWKGQFTFRRAAIVPAEDRSGPEIELVSPLADTSLASGTGSWVVRVRARDTSRVQSVTIQDVAATLGADTVWAAAVPLASDSNPIRIVAADSYGNTGTRTLSIFVGQTPGLRLSRLGQSVGEAIPPTGSDAIWTLRVPNLDSAVTLDPRPMDTLASLLREGQPVTQPIRLSFGPAGDTEEIALSVRSAAGDTVRNWLVRVVHLPPKPIDLLPIGGDAPRFPYTDTAATFAWSVRGNRAIGAVSIQGQQATCAGDTCHLRIPLPQPGKTPVVIAASYAGLESLEWRDTIEAERMTPPLENDARLLNFGYDLPVQLVSGDTSWVASVRNDIDSVTLVPIPAYAGADASFYPNGEKRMTVRFKADGDTIQDLRVLVQAKDGISRAMHHLRIEHAPPAPIIFEPEHGAEWLVPFDSSSVVLRWSVQGSRKLGAVTIGSDTLRPGPDGRYRDTLRLPHAGRYGARIRASYQGGMLAWSDSVTVERQDTSAPRVLMGRDSRLGRIVGIAERSFPLTWGVTDNDTVVSVTLNDGAVAPVDGGTYSKTLDLVADTNRVTIVARDLAGHQTQLSGMLLLDSARPVVNTGLKGDTVTVSSRLLSGVYEARLTVTDNYGLDSIWVGYKDERREYPISLESGPFRDPLPRTIWDAPVRTYTFTYTFAYVVGRNIYTIRARDVAGNERLVTFAVIVL